MTQLLQVEVKVCLDEEKWSWLSNKSKVGGWEAIKGYSGAKNMSKNNYDRVGSPSSFSKTPSIPSIGHLYEKLVILSPITEKVNNSTLRILHMKNTPLVQTLPSSLPPIGNLSLISYSENTQTYNTLTSPKLPEHNNPPVVMADTHPVTLRGNNFPEAIITDHNVQPKFKAQAGFMRNSVVLCPSLYIYHDEVSWDDPIE